MWSLSWGAQLKTLREIKETTGVAPKALQDMPKLRHDCRGYLEAFNFLSDAREYNQAGVQPLRLTEIQAYLALTGISGMDRKAKLVRVIRELDSVFMQRHFEQQEKQQT